MTRSEFALVELQEYIEDLQAAFNHYPLSPRLLGFFAEKCAHYAFMAFPELRPVEERDLNK